MLARLIARDFRNFTHLDLALPPAGLVIIGENGHGKTSLLEAVAYLSLLRTLRGARDADVVRFGANVFHVRGELTTPARFDTVGVGYERSSRRKRATLDGVEQGRLTAALGAVPSVCFSPADVVLVAGGPSERRRYLDVTLALSSPAYLYALQQYRAALARRNAALRTGLRDGARVGGTHHELARVWEPALARHGAMISTIRQSFVHQQLERFTTLAESIGERQLVTMRYISSLGGASVNAAMAERASLTATVQSRANEEALVAAYAQQRGLELRRGVTLVGPHRDELQLLLGGRELRTFGSAGQQRSAAIALRLLELTTLRDAIGSTPLLLLDDPFAELDSGRAARVLDLLDATGVGQVLLAVPRVQDIPPAFGHLTHRTVRDGAIVSDRGLA